MHFVFLPTLFEGVEFRLKCSQQVPFFAHSLQCSLIFITGFNSTLSVGFSELHRHFVHPFEDSSEFLQLLSRVISTEVKLSVEYLGVNGTRATEGFGSSDANDFVFSTGSVVFS